METFRADIDAANDNRVRERRKWILTAIVVFIGLMTIAYIQIQSYLFKGLPDLPNKAAMWELNLQPNTTLFDNAGNRIGHRGPYLGRPLTIAEMPKYLPDAFLAIEDERFYEHTGIDRKAIFRAFFENTRAGKTVQGGSTLTQQLVKNMVLTPEKTYRRKFQEMWLAYEMEEVLTKPEILSLYLNRIDLGNRSFGVEAASQRYFGKKAKDLTLSESAMLAGLPKAPSRYDPSKNYEQALVRSYLVLDRMFANNLITFDEAKAAKANPPIIIEPVDDEIDPKILGHVFDLAKERANELIGNAQNDLIIHITLDTDIQKSAHEALTKILNANEKSKKVANGALVTIDVRTGGIRALIGGRDYNQSKFNRAAQAKRQPGSAFKPFVYAAALEENLTPGTVRIDQPTTISGWTPENYTKRYRGPMTIREALKLSVNTIAAQVGAEIGPRKVARFGKRLGINTELRPTYSLSLGSSEVTLVDITGAYTVFANEGVRRTPYLIETIKNTSGETLYTRSKTKPTRVYAVPFARQMTNMLKEVIETGTGHGAQIGTRELAGKTGTSQDYRDAWFVGYSQQYATGVWLGNDDNTPMKSITGGLLPVDVWKDHMVTIHKGLKKQPLITEDMTAFSADTQRIMRFYETLANELILERNVASGIQNAEQIPQLSSPQSANVISSTPAPQRGAPQRLAPQRLPRENLTRN